MQVKCISLFNLTQFFAHRLRQFSHSFNYTVTRHRCNYQELKYIIFRSALIHVLAHFQRTTCSQIYFHFSSYTAGNRHKQNSWFCKEIREDNFRFWWRRVHEDASQGMYMSKIEIFLFTARILQNQRMLCCGECFHD